MMLFYLALVQTFKIIEWILNIHEPLLWLAQENVSSHKMEYTRFTSEMKTEFVQGTYRRSNNKRFLQPARSQTVFVSTTRKSRLLKWLFAVQNFDWFYGWTDVRIRELVSRWVGNGVDTEFQSEHWSNSYSISSNQWRMHSMTVYGYASQMAAASARAWVDARFRLFQPIRIKRLGWIKKVNFRGRLYSMWSR